MAVRMVVAVDCRMPVRTTECPFLTKAMAVCSGVFANDYWDRRQKFKSHTLGALRLLEVGVEYKSRHCDVDVGVALGHVE